MGKQELFIEYITWAGQKYFYYKKRVLTKKLSPTEKMFYYWIKQNPN